MKILVAAKLTKGHYICAEHSQITSIKHLRHKNVAVAVCKRIFFNVSLPDNYL